LSHRAKIATLINDELFGRCLSKCVTVAAIPALKF